MHMSTGHFLKRAAFGLMLAVLTAQSVSAQNLKPFKDDLFSYQNILETADNGDYLVAGYDEMRDINGRDQIPERRVKSAYVSLGVRRAQVDETASDGARAIGVTRVGAADGAAFSVIFIHGRGGDRRLGANDYSFGGNFNRVKNLAASNGGAYYAPTIRTFDGEGVADVAMLISVLRQRSKARPVVLACASMGSFICSGIARDSGAAANLAGMMILGGAPDPDFTASAAYKAKLPVFFSHGSNDSVYSAEQQVNLYRKLKAAGYPARFVLFNTGSHGTPVRMTDWRDTLNWIFAQR